MCSYLHLQTFRQSSYEWKLLLLPPHPVNENGSQSSRSLSKYHRGSFRRQKPAFGRRVQYPNKEKKYQRADLIAEPL